MKTVVKTLLIQFAVLMAVSAVAVPAHAQVSVTNSSSYVGGGRWDWTIYLDADAHTLQQIACVEYRLHPTFPNPVRKVCNQSATNFAFSSNGWGTFAVGVNIFYKNATTQQLNHHLVFEEKSATNSVNVIPKNWSRLIEEGWWEWGIFVDGTPAELSKIRCVEYTLHKSFPNPVRVICSPQNRFKLVARGWGTFTVNIRLLLNDGTTRQLSHRLTLQ